MPTLDDRNCPAGTMAPRSRKGRCHAQSYPAQDFGSVAESFDRRCRNGAVNDLLLPCNGMRFTIEIQTQRELASGELREGFEILVHDADNDKTKAVTVMSGGQKVWINKCLTRGIALYHARNAGQPYQTLFSDESVGPLDPKRKVQFMRMKREVLKQGGYSPCATTDADHLALLQMDLFSMAT